jgi:hypothetical protein
MLRRTWPIAVCCLAFVIGCSKREPAAAPATPAGPAVSAPDGMVALQEKPPVFLTKSPVTVAEYVQYIKASRQPVPEAMRAVALGGPGGDQPVSNLTRKQADRCATWNLKRLPTEQEWAKASAVATGPYPWGGTDEAIPVATPLYLAQDWLPGTPQEQKAQAKKQELEQALEAERAAGFGQARQELADLVKARKAAAEERWQQFKPAFFKLVEVKKHLGELNGQTACRQDVLAIVARMATAKGKVAATVALAENDPKPAIKAYQDQLAQWRADEQTTRQSLEDKTKQLQQDVLKQTDAFDQLDAKTIADKFAEVDALLQQSAQAPTDARAASDLQSKLVAATQDLKSAPLPFDSLPDPAALAKDAADEQKQIDTFPADKETTAKIADLKDHIQSFGQSIGQDFLDEKLLLQDLDTLPDLRSHRDAVQANLTALTGLMRQLSTPEPAAR